jgi:hypothetical protein
MKRIMPGLMVASFLLGASSLVGTASAEPVKLTKKQMASITAGTITPGSPGHNPGGQPGGCSNNPNCTPPTPATNPAGKAPPGQNR